MTTVPTSESSFSTPPRNSRTSAGAPSSPGGRAGPRTARSLPSRRPDRGLVLVAETATRPPANQHKDQVDRFPGCSHRRILSPDPGTREAGRRKALHPPRCTAGLGAVSAGLAHQDQCNRKPPYQTSSSRPEDLETYGAGCTPLCWSRTVGPLTHCGAFAESERAVCRSRAR